MAFELVYTSVPQGIQPGRSGFCIAAYTNGMSTSVAQLLESLSGYKPAFHHYHENADKNPVAFSHYITSNSGENLHVFSRTCFYGLDYTQRSNKLAHHIVANTQELAGFTDGPAAVMTQQNIFRTTWNEPPQLFQNQITLQPASLPEKRANAWELATGDAGWAAVLAQADTTKPAYIIFDPLKHDYNLELVTEALMLVPPDKRWNISFNTYYTTRLANIACNWRFCTPDSDLIKEAKRIPGTLVIDLTETLPKAPDSPLAKAARTGNVMACFPKAQPVETSPQITQPQVTAQHPQQPQIDSPTSEPTPLKPQLPPPTDVSYPQDTYNQHPVPATRPLKTIVTAAIALLLFVAGIALILFNRSDKPENHHSTANPYANNNTNPLPANTPSAAQSEQTATVASKPQHAPSDTGTQPSENEQSLKLEQEKKAREEQARMAKAEAERKAKEEQARIAKAEAEEKERKARQQEQEQRIDHNRKYAFCSKEAIDFKQGKTHELKLELLKPGDRIHTLTLVQNNKMLTFTPNPDNPQQAVANDVRFVGIQKHLHASFTATIQPPYLLLATDKATMKQKDNPVKNITIQPQNGTEITVYLDFVPGKTTLPNGLLTTTIPNKKSLMENISELPSITFTHKLGENEVNILPNHQLILEIKGHTTDKQTLQLPFVINDKHELTATWIPDDFKAIIDAWATDDDDSKKMITQRKKQEEELKSKETLLQKLSKIEKSKNKGNKEKKTHFQLLQEMNRKLKNAVYAMKQKDVKNTYDFCNYHASNETLNDLKNKIKKHDKPDDLKKCHNEILNFITDCDDISKLTMHDSKQTVKSLLPQSVLTILEEYMSMDYRELPSLRQTPDMLKQNIDEIKKEIQKLNDHLAKSTKKSNQELEKHSAKAFDDVRQKLNRASFELHLKKNENFSTKIRTFNKEIIVK